MNEATTPSEPRGPEFRSGHGWLRLGLVWIWALPATAIGVGIGLAGLATGAHCRRIGHTLEFYGGCIDWLLEQTPVRAAGLTLGHVILGRTSTVLDVVRFHEWVHVRQYERWGPFFIPAYLSCSAVLIMLGRDGYRENPFEIEAFTADLERLSRSPPTSGNPPLC